MQFLCNSKFHGFVDLAAKPRKADWDTTDDTDGCIILQSYFSSESPSRKISSLSFVPTSTASFIKSVQSVKSVVKQCIV